jgi:sporulation protein YlmC with PRC-barrel domain
MNQIINSADTISFSVWKKFEIDYSKIKTIEDIVIVLRSMNIQLSWSDKHVPDRFKEIYEKGFLKEVQ